MRSPSNRIRWIHFGPSLGLPRGTRARPRSQGSRGPAHARHVRAATVGEGVLASDPKAADIEEMGVRGRGGRGRGGEMAKVSTIAVYVVNSLLGQKNLTHLVL